MLVGPVFTREVVVAPRRTRLYVARAAYVASLLVLMCTAWLLLTGTQSIRNLGDLARFGGALFQILAPLQLALALFFSALMAASAVAQEKDRRTLVLLLLTSLTNSELVLGKLLAALLNVLVLLAAALPLFMLAVLFGGISFEQIGRVFAVTLLSTLAAGSLGSMLALWREKTFQTLALTLLVLVFWLLIGEAIAHGALGERWAGIAATDWSAMISPWQAVMAATRPLPSAEHTLPLVGNAVNGFLLLALALTIVVNSFAVLRVRVWNPSREARSNREQAEEREDVPGQSLAPGASARPSVHAAPGKTRQPWDNPILWREIRTWAYGRRVLIVRLAYLVLFAASAAAIYSLVNSPTGLMRSSAALALVPLLVLSLTLVNAQAVTSLTSERDIHALDLLLVTDLSAKEFVFGKLGGVIYNTKEMILLPLALFGYLWLHESISGENTFYLAAGLLVMVAFVAMLGVHAGMSYNNSQSAIGVSLGTVFFLFIGVATCMRMMVAFSGSFGFQLAPFVVIVAGGWIGLYLALGHQNPSLAIGVASFVCPTATFYAITSLLLGNTLSVFLVIALTYGFVTAALLIPAIAEFDTVRTSGDE